MKRRVILISLAGVVLLLTGCPNLFDSGGGNGGDDTVGVTGVTLDQTILAMVVGDTVDLTATVAPENASDKTVSWSSDNEDVATVSDSGTVTAVAAGVATITVTTNDGGFSATSDVTATTRTADVAVDPDTLLLGIGETGTLTATVSPADADDKTVSWSSSDSAIATVDTDGVVTGVADGTATITATTNDGGLTDEATITVVVLYTISYNANGAESGTVPDEQIKYGPFDLTLAENTGNLVRTGFQVSGWNTESDGFGTTYPLGGTYTSESDATLYADWEAKLALPAVSDSNIDSFGSRVGMSGDYFIVGAPATRHDLNGDNFFNEFNVGSAYIYYRSGPGNSWDTGTELLAADAAYNDNFGWSTAMDGDYAIVGAHQDSIDVDGDSTEEQWVGSAHVFHRTGQNSWDAGTKLTASDGAAMDIFGSSVALSGDYAVVGADLDDIDLDTDGTDESNVGSVYVFRRIGTNSWDAGVKLTAPDAAADDRFGVRVAIDGDYIVVSAIGADDNGTDSGSVYVFQNTGTNTWDSGTKLTASDGAAGDRFGVSVAISGDYAVVGADLDDDKGSNSGSAYVFHRTGTDIWDSGTKLTPDDGAADDNFGGQVSISGDTLIVGAGAADPGGVDAAGSVYVFQRTGTNVWDTGTRVLAEDGINDDRFGNAVAIDGTYAVIGAPHPPNVNPGKAYVLDWTP